MDPKISIVVPVYNVAEYLREGLASFLGQTMRELEVICVDDCSTDESAAILRETAQNDPRVHLAFHSENFSAAQCRKDGALLAKGEYVLFCDPDDLLIPEACEELYARAKEEDTDVLHFSSEPFGSDDVPQSRLNMVARMLVNPEQRLEEGIIETCFLRRKFGFQIWNKLFRGDLVREAMQHFPDGIFPKAQDLMAVFVLFYFAQNYVSVKTTPYYRYRVGVGVTGGNTLTRRQIEGYAAQALVARGLRAFLAARNDEERYDEVLKAIESDLFKDSMNRFCNFIREEDYAFAFDVYSRAWGAAKLVGELSMRYLYAEESWIKRFAGAQSLSFIPRETKVIGTFYHSIRNGGAQRVVVETANLFTRMGYKVILFTDSEPTEGEYPLAEGIERVVLPEGIRAKEHRAERMQMLYDKVREYHIDFFLYHAWISAMLFWDLLSVKSAGAAFYIYTHNIFSMPVLSQYTIRAFRSSPGIYALADGVTALNDTDAHYWRHFNGRVFKVTNPITYDLSQTTVNELNGRTILWTGRISWEKYPTHLIEIMRIVHKEIPDARLLLVGSGSESIEQTMREKTKEYGLSGSVEFCGFQTDLARYYAQADVFLCPSKYEGFCLTILEAQSYGVPVVAYDMPYLTILETGLGSISVPQGNFKAAAAAVIRLLRDTEERKRLGAEARRNIEENFDVDMTALWQPILASTSAGRPAIPFDKHEICMLETLIFHTGDALTREKKKAESTAAPVTVRTVADEGVLPFTVNTPAKGPCKVLRRKIKTFICVLMLRGPAGVRQVLREKRGN